MIERQAEATRLVALLTDFGTRDYFVPSLKAVIAGINPRARTIDITHDVPSFDIRAASFILQSCYAFFPRGTVFVAVVDPGVASGRPILLAETQRHAFIAPDNGLLTLTLRNEKILALRRLTESRFWLASSATTFEARDRMAPVAAWLTLGVPPEEFGLEIRTYRRLKIREPVRLGREVRGEILYRDKFDNLITNIPVSMFPTRERTEPRPDIVLAVGTKRIRRLARSYAEIRDRNPFLVVNSLGLIEIAVREGSAAEATSSKPGDQVVIRFER